MLEHSRQVSYQISRSPQEKFEFNGLRTEDGYSSGFWRFDSQGSGTKSPESKAPSKTGRLRTDRPCPGVLFGHRLVVLS
jgi:hypothetical protein